MKTKNEMFYVEDRLLGRAGSISVKCRLGSYQSSLAKKASKNMSLVWCANCGNKFCRECLRNHNAAHGQCIGEQALSYAVSGQKAVQKKGQSGTEKQNGTEKGAKRYRKRDKAVQKKGQHLESALSFRLHVRTRRTKRGRGHGGTRGDARREERHDERRGSTGQGARGSGRESTDREHRQGAQRKEHRERSRRRGVGADGEMTSKMRNSVKK